MTRPIIALAVLALTVVPALAQDPKPAAPLVTRNRVELNLAGAELILAAAKEKAAALKVTANVAVVDAGGHLLAFARMDGARPASGQTALTKAVSAATFRQETGTLPAKGEPDVLLSLGVAMAAAASGGKVTPLKGGRADRGGRAGGRGGRRERRAGRRGGQGRHRGPARPPGRNQMTGRPRSAGGRIPRCVRHFLAVPDLMSIESSSNAHSRSHPWHPNSSQ